MGRPNILQSAKRGSARDQPWVDMLRNDSDVGGVQASRPGPMERASGIYHKQDFPVGHGSRVPPTVAVSLRLVKAFLLGVPCSARRT